MPAATRSRPSLPTTTSRRAGESWTSLCARVAVLNGLTSAQLGRWTNLPVGDDILTDAQVQRASTALRLPVSEIGLSILGRWTNDLYRTPPRSTPSRSGPAWTWTGTTNSCTHCLAEGTSRLEWRLPWILTCEKHHLGPRSQPTPSPETYVLSTHFLDLGNASAASGKTLETIEIWRDAITLAQALGRSSAHRRQDLHPAHHRANLLHALAPLTMATDPEERASTLYTWCVDAGITRPTKCTLPTFHSRTLKDAIDCITALWWQPKRHLHPASGRG